MNIATTSIEDLIVYLENDDEEILGGYSIFGELEDGRSLLLADVIADTHPAIDLEDHETMGSPTLSESQAIAHLLAAAPQLRRLVLTLALTALSNDGYVGLDQAQSAIDVIHTIDNLGDISPGDSA